MNRQAYIIPGFRESHLGNKSYEKIADLLKKAGITPIHVEIDWETTSASFDDYAAQFLRQFKKQKGTETIVFGYSFGAIIALLTEGTTRPERLILCSLSPYFLEDQKNLKSQWLHFWKRRFPDSTYEFNTIAPKVRSTTLLVVGSEEDYSVQYRARSARRRIKDSTLVIAPGAKHALGKNYLATLEKIID